MRRSILLAFAALVLTAPAALAEESCHVSGTVMPKTAMEKSLAARGYTHIRSLSEHHGCYEAKGFDRHGKRFELEVNGQTGAIQNVE